MKHIFIGKWMPGMRTFLNQRFKSEIDKKARERLKWLDWHFSHGANISLTARHFGIARGTLYRWLNYYSPGCLQSLQDRSRKPKQCRKRTTRASIWQRVCELREQYPKWGKKKLHWILMKEGVECSESSVGRIITEKGFPNAKRKYRKTTAYRKQTVLRKRRPKGLTLKHAGQMIQMDSVIIQHNGKKIAIITAMDLATRVAYASVHRTTNSKAAWKTLVKFRELLGNPIEAVHTDNGSEFLGEFHAGCQREGITHYFSPPRTPKNHAHIERFNGTLQSDGIYPLHLTLPIAQIREELSKFLVTYNLFRPHESLRMKTPFEYYMYKQFPSPSSRPEVFNMYWTKTTG